MRSDRSGLAARGVHFLAAHGPAQKKLEEERHWKLRIRGRESQSGATDFRPSSLPLCHSLSLSLHSRAWQPSGLYPDCTALTLLLPTDPTHWTNAPTYTEEESVFSDAISHSWKLDEVRIMCVDMHQFLLYLSLLLSLWMQSRIRCPAW